jgi:hypothetical protein
MEEAVKAKRKHMVAASDYLLPQCKEENVRALCDAVRNYNPFPAVLEQAQLSQKRSAYDR